MLLSFLVSLYFRCDILAPIPVYLCTVWRHRMLHRKWNIAVQPSAANSPFPVRHPVSLHSITGELHSRKQIQCTFIVPTFCANDVVIAGLEPPVRVRHWHRRRRRLRGNLLRRRPRPSRRQQRRGRSTAAATAAASTPAAAASA